MKKLRFIASVVLAASASSYSIKTERIPTSAGSLKLKVMRPREQEGLVPGILWIHGGGYMTGGTYMVPFTEGKKLAKRLGAVMVSPNYRLARTAPYPAALEDCYAALKWMYDHADELGIDRNRIIVGGESAGGGLTAALCLYSRDKGGIPIALQLPLYPMLDCEDTPSSAHNPGLTWGTRRNHWGWQHYLGELYGTDSIPPYASPARETDYSGLPPCYTYVLDGEPFHDETLTYVRNLQNAGVEAYVDVYHGHLHAFDILLFWQKQSKQAKEKLCEMAERMLN